METSDVVTFNGIQYKYKAVNELSIPESSEGYFACVYGFRVLVLKDFSNNPPAFRQELN